MDFGRQGDEPPIGEIWQSCLFQTPRFDPSTLSRPPAFGRVSVKLYCFDVSFTESSVRGGARLKPQHRPALWLAVCAALVDAEFEVRCVEYGAIGPL